MAVSAAVSTSPAPLASGRYDALARRRADRSQRERGCWVDIPAEELVKAGIDPHGPAPWYRTWGYRRSRTGHSVIVALYREP